MNPKLCLNTSTIKPQPLMEKIRLAGEVGYDGIELWINDLYEQGATIILNTARGMGRYKNNSEKAYESFYKLTVKQLNSWGVKYHQLFLGKPSGDIYIDDKGVNDEDFFDTRD